MATNKTVSFSQYQVYKTCAHRWYLDYVKKLNPFQPSIHLIFGTAFHETLQLYLQVMFESSAKEADKLNLPFHLKKKLIELYTAHAVNGHFSTPEELTEFYEDGVAILEFFKKKRQLFFTKKNCELVGIEFHINGPIVDEIPNVHMKGFIDLIIYDKTLDKYTIYDIKTSTKGWSDYEKRDQVKVNQVLLYKKFFSRLKGIDESKVDVQFFIVRRKINENLEFVPKRIQEFKPANGTRKVKEAFEDIQNFVKDVFTPEGEYQEKEYPKNPANCRFCPYIDKPELCDKKNK